MILGLTSSVVLRRARLAGGVLVLAGGGESASESGETVERVRRVPAIVLDWRAGDEVEDEGAAAGGLPFCRKARRSLWRDSLAVVGERAVRGNGDEATRERRARLAAVEVERSSSRMCSGARH